MTECGTGEGFGTVTWWGFSPAMDFQKQGLSASMKALRCNEDGVPELNILMVGAGDSRHLLTTICQAHRWPARKLHFYIVENNLELVGRHLLFLTIALERPSAMGLQEKTELFLELFGNSLIRSQTATYLQQSADNFIHYVTDLDCLEKKLPMVDMCSLKASVINNRQYYQWRDKGLAFVNREGLYDVPNKSLASGLLVNCKGEKIAARGFWGDIVTSPYVAYGIVSEEGSLLKKANGIYVKTAQDISQYNVTALFHELLSKERYVLLPQPKEEASLSEVTEDEAEELEEASRTRSKPAGESEQTVTEGQALNQSPEPVVDSTGPTEYDYLPLPDVKIHFLPLNCVTELHNRSSYRNLFNVIYVSCSMVHQLQPELQQMAAPRATLIVELTKFMLDLRSETVGRFADRAAELAAGAGFLPFGSVDSERDAFARFELKEDP
ncbi:dynein axonemal assembly factor 3 isoform X2 [Rhinoraja longicauda]